MNSFNHYAFGSIGSWIIERLAGIRPSSPGYKTSIIEPQLINGITYVNASRETPYGILSSNWKCLDNLITIDINIPARNNFVQHTLYEVIRGCTISEMLMEYRKFVLEMNYKPMIN